MRETQDGWDYRIEMVIRAVAAVQDRRHTASLQELAGICSVSRQTVAVWLKRAEKAGLIDRHDGQPRALELLPLAWTILAKKKKRIRRALFKV